VGERKRRWAFSGRDAISAMILSEPGTWTVVSLPACHTWSMTAKPRRSRPAVGVLALEAIFSTQLTVGVLSQRVPSGACRMLGACSNIIPMAKTAAANSRSELVMEPAGLASDTTAEVMSGGKTSRQTIGGM
jgi:hypothetical protein